MHVPRRLSAWLGEGAQRRIRQVRKLSYIYVLKWISSSLLAGDFSGMLASRTNVSLAAAVMTVEVFGFQYSILAAFAAVVGFQINRHFALYDYRRISSDEESSRNRVQ